MTQPRQPLAFLHGRFLPQAEAMLTLHDAGFVMGATVTDLCRTFRGTLFRWQDHLARFRASCRAVEVDVALSDEEISKRAQELAAHNFGLCSRELCLVLFGTPGPVGYYLGEPGGAGDGPVTFGMHTFPVPFERYRRLLATGAELVVAKVRQLPAVCVDPRIKMRSRLHWWLADREVRRTRPEAIALLVNEAGHVTETAAANFAIVREGTLLCPPGHEVLGGVSLGVVRELCAELSIPVEEKSLTVQECLDAEEAMLTSTPYCIAGVRSLQDRVFPCPGPITHRLQAAWSKQVGLDIWKQASVDRPPI